ncbi:ATP-dependent RecD-like DNA helicase [Actinokineospora sp. PR83]|uniref:SF1B family DNA helicase RecD2 n=1 Tax=Actinokineospora sp. PR83 TaxID=2884908 RepID=UPI0027DF700B|nr:ATP-dependent RecD-like DNA helicase [Actinokineospora sp. PR83]MCG8915690.1 ATP-dependent RecD-like DNA helicase [Actinokineospora sp. PR83]
MSSAPEGSDEVVEGVVDRVIHVGPDGHTVAVLSTGESGEPVKVAGTVLAGLRPGETLRVTGRRPSTARHADTLRVLTCERVLPATVHAIRAYLGSGMIKGIGPTIAQAIVDRFGAETLTVIDTTPELLLGVSLIGRKRLATIVEGWAEQREIREVMVFLQGVGVTPGLAVRIHRHLGAEARQIVEQHPYQLIERVHGIGFRIADKIAVAVGIPERSGARMRAALLHVLDEARGKGGHCYLPREELLAAAVALVRQDPELVRDGLDELRDMGSVVVERTPALFEDELVFPAWLHRRESTLAENVRRLLAAPSQLPRRAGAVAEEDPPLGQRQAEAVEMALTETLSILTGGPGSGKSHTVAALVRRAKAAGATVALAAPTGRAAKRLSELTGLRATTVHRLVHHRDNPVDDGGLFDPNDGLSSDLVVVDEASMLDVLIAERLLRAIPEGSHLLLVGDVDQLPSVGPGAVLHDLLGVADIPSTRLDTIYRQDADSGIVSNANRVVHGRPPVNGPQFWFHDLDADKTADVAELVVDIATRRLPAKQGCTPAEVQILCPGKARATGATSLSRLAQDHRNPARDTTPEHWADDRPFRVGDKVMPTRNDPTKGDYGVFNGATATITAINKDDQQVEIALDDGQTATYDFDELETLAHAYAITVHRSQGSEYPYVVIPLTNDTPHLLLQRNLLYTAITRARKLVVIVGHRGALFRALDNRPRRRNTLLTHRLSAIGPSQAPPTRTADGQQFAF